MENIINGVQEDISIIEAIINGVQEKIKTIPGIKYVDEDWGQLDYYSPNPPVQWPCVLIDVTEANFNDIGVNIQKEPKNRQTAQISVSLTIANLKLTNSSGKAPKTQQAAARSIHGLINQVHKKIHGKQAYEGSGTLIRKSLRRVKRDDGIQEYNVIYRMPVKDV